MIARWLVLVRFILPVLGKDQEVMSQKTHGHLMMPTQPGADLLMVRKQATFTLFNGFLKGPPATHSLTNVLFPKPAGTETTVNLR